MVADALNVQPTSRLKTTVTLIEKLKRSGTRLSTMQDIAGIRVVEEWDLSQQDDAVRKLESVLDVARVDDLREGKHEGYRAVHVIARVEGCFVEIQLRTRSQDQWAQSFEKLADLVGRGIRYGEKPERDIQGKAQESISVLREASESLKDAEEQCQTIKMLRARIASGAPGLNEEARARAAEIEHELVGLEAKYQSHKGELLELVERIPTEVSELD